MASVVMAKLPTIPNVAPQRMIPSKSSLGGAFAKGAGAGAVAGSSFGPLGALIGSAVSGLFSLGSTALQNRYNRKQVDKQWKRELQQWERENAYNDPSAQMARLKSAGLSPNLMYSDANGANTSASSPSASFQQSSDIEPALISAYQSLAGLKNQTDQTSSNIALQDSQRVLNNMSAMTEGAKADNYIQDTLNKIIQNRGFHLDNELKSRLQDYQVGNAMWQNELLKMNMLKLSYDTDISKWEAKSRGYEYQNILPEQLKKWQADVKYLDEQNRRFLNGFGLLDNQALYDILYGVGKKKDIKHPQLRGLGYQTLGKLKFPNIGLGVTKLFK